MPPSRILIIGGYGAFGIMAAQRLVRNKDVEIVIAGRNADRAELTAKQLAADNRTKARINHTTIDATTCKPKDLSETKARVIINASGPFQHQDYSLASACIAAGIHYIDLADSRTFVVGIKTLDNQAKEAGVAVISGASSLPGLSSAVVANYRPRFQSLEDVHIGLSPGYQFEFGIATMRSVLSYVGKPIKMWINRDWQNVYGWQGLSRHDFHKLGHRWLGYAEVPDLDLFVENDPKLQTVSFKGGVELSFIHLGLWSLSGLVRSRLVHSLEPAASVLRNINSLFVSFGSNKGGMYVALHGRDQKGKPKKLQWTLIAESGHGPNIPAIASVILARRFSLTGDIKPGARPCFEEFTLQEFVDEVQDLDISFHVSEEIDITQT